LGHVILDRKVDTRFAFYDRMMSFDEKTTFQHFDFVRSKEENAAASGKAAELLKKSPYKDQLRTANLFIAELHRRAKEIPNLISPRLGDSIMVGPSVVAGAADKSDANQIVALPLGGRVKLDPWDDSLDLLKSKPVGNITESEKKPFEITPFVLYLTRVTSDLPKISQNTGSQYPESIAQGSHTQ
jgi:hypothetical protein